MFDTDLAYIKQMLKKRHCLSFAKLRKFTSYFPDPLMGPRVSYFPDPSNTELQLKFYAWSCLCEKQSLIHSYEC